jgi:hypothetical protein
MTKELGKILKSETEVFNEEATAFCNGFAQGFLVSFDGWNGQTFKEFDRQVVESEIFMERMKQGYINYMENVKEMRKLMEEFNGLPASQIN